jgi:hypothetical protein
MVKTMIERRVENNKEEKKRVNKGNENVHPFFTPFP